MKKIQIKTYHSNDPSKLSSRVNGFLDKIKEDDFIDIKQSECCDDKDFLNVTISIIYKEDKEENN